MTQQSQRVTSKLGMFPCYADHLGKFVICKGKTEKMITQCCVFVVKQRIKTGIFKMFCIDKLLFNPFHQPDHPVFCHQQQGLSWQENTSTLCNHLHSKTKIYSLLKKKVDAVVFALLLKWFLPDQESEGFRVKSATASSPGDKHRCMCHSSLRVSTGWLHAPVNWKSKFIPRIVILEWLHAPVKGNQKLLERDD